MILQSRAWAPTMTAVTGNQDGRGADLHVFALPRAGNTGQSS
jgi:hypothetical protein